LAACNLETSVEDRGTFLHSIDAHGQRTAGFEKKQPTKNSEKNPFSFLSEKQKPFTESTYYPGYGANAGEF